MSQKKLSLTVRRPRMNQQFPIGVDFLVSGTATGTGGVEPHPIDSVTVQVGSESPVEADLTPVPPFPSFMLNFSVTARLNSPGENTITVRATNDIGRSITEVVTVSTPGTPIPLATAFKFIAKLTTNCPWACGPFVQKDLSMLLTFNAMRNKVRITHFTLFTTPQFQTPLGENKTTVSMKEFNDGTFFPDTGHMVLKLSLFFDQSLDMPILTEDSSMNNLLLSTMVEPGSPLNRETKELTLAGTGVFTDGVLGSYQGNLALVGALQDLP